MSAEENHEHAAAVLWFTGLSGAGKSTIASAVTDELARRGVPTEYLDGDAIRAIVPTGFSRSERDAHIKHVGLLASRLERRGIAVVCALISPFTESRDYVRRLCTRFIEVYVATPLEECERRDPKGLYRLARQGKITQFTGVDSPYEAPSAPELILQTVGSSIEESVEAVLRAYDRAVGSRARGNTPVADQP